MFDILGILADGSLDLNATQEPVSITESDRAGNRGYLCLDIRGTPATGLSVVIICTGKTVAGATVAGGAMAAIRLEGDDDVAFTRPTEQLGEFGDCISSSSSIHGVNLPIVVTGRFSTSKRYIRILLREVIGNLGVVKIYLTPYTFKVL